MSESRKPKIVTKTGDRGQSRLFSGETVSKDHPRLDAFGDVDELNCVLGVARGCVQKERLREEILQLQRQLFIVAGELAVTPEKRRQLSSPVDESFLNDFEKKVEALYAVTPIPNDFIIPGATQASAFLDLARTVARRAERKIVALKDQGEISNPYLITWINRLSDYLYLMARFEEGEPTRR